ncbi:MAG: GNAT family N-acetyltransferase [Alcanivoracaceae bacterium]|nr:GNAT family N-acetyltransferase [Alcanivoracaceae bacterium]
MTVIIRHSEKDDIRAIKEIYQEPSCYSGTLQHPYPSESMWSKRLTEIPANFFSLVAVLDEAVVAQAGMEVNTRSRRKHVANIGMAVREKYQAKGIGSELLKAVIKLANNWLAVSRIELEVFTDNKSAVKLYKSHGFAIEGTGKSYAFRDGEYADVYFMAKVDT